MDQKLLSYLKKHQIKYIIHEHPAVFTVEESKKIIKNLDHFLHTKNLFLRDESNKFYLVCMRADDKLDLKILQKKINTKGKLTFASPEELKENLNLTPGSVSIFGMIYSSKVTLILDENVYLAERVGFHPNINSATLELTQVNLRRFYESLTSEKKILKLPIK